MIVLSLQSRPRPDAACPALCSRVSGVTPIPAFGVKAKHSFRHVHGSFRRLVVSQATAADELPVPKKTVSFVLLAGGVGKRMGAPMPKQYLPLQGQPIATHSLDTFLGLQEAMEIVIVCAEDWRYIFEDHLATKGSEAIKVPIKFALPGKERFDSVFNGFKATSPDAALVAIHDSARPFATPAEIRACLADAANIGAAVLGVRCKGTIKQVDGALMVEQTLERAKLWEVHTPQIIKPALLTQGFDKLYGGTSEPQYDVTDDVSLVELIGEPVKITEGQYTNIKVTTPEDMDIANNYLKQKQEEKVSMAT